MTDIFTTTCWGLRSSRGVLKPYLFQSREKARKFTKAGPYKSRDTVVPIFVTITDLSKGKNDTKANI